MKDFNYLYHVNVEELHIKCNFMFLFPMNNLARKHPG